MKDSCRRWAAANKEFGLVAAQIPLLRPGERQTVYRFADPW